LTYTVDENLKIITVQGSPSLFKFVEMANKRFPNDEWKEYRISFDSIDRTQDAQQLLQTALPNKFKWITVGDREEKILLVDLSVKPTEWTWERFLMSMKAFDTNHTNVA
jgi:hypothetical protein